MRGRGGSYSLDGRGPLLADLGVLLLDNEHPLLPRDFEDEVVWVQLLGLLLLVGENFRSLEVNNTLGLWRNSLRPSLKNRVRGI